MSVKYMSFSLRPKYVIKSLLDLTPQMLKDRGIELLILDLDNTISPYGEKLPSEKVLKWTEDMKKGGIKAPI